MPATITATQNKKFVDAQGTVTHYSVSTSGPERSLVYFFKLSSILTVPAIRLFLVSCEKT